MFLNNTIIKFFNISKKTKHDENSGNIIANDILYFFPQQWRTHEDYGEHSSLMYLLDTGY